MLRKFYEMAASLSGGGFIDDPRDRTDVKGNLLCVGDTIVIKSAGGGTGPEDVGKECKIVNIGKNIGQREMFANTYTIEIDKNKAGNNDRFLSPRVVLLVKPAKKIGIKFKLPK